MISNFFRIKFSFAVITAAIFAGTLFLLPSLSIASETAAAQFFVSAWLVRIWLALVSGSAIVIGAMIAMDSYEASPTLEPQLTPDAKVVITKQYKLSYLKIGGGLLCAFVGCALFVTSVFLLPDIRTGHSGIGKIVSHFTGSQHSIPSDANSGHSVPAPPGH
jgi:hypothetical protein